MKQRKLLQSKFTTNFLFSLSAALCLLVEPASALSPEEQRAVAAVEGAQADYDTAMNNLEGARTTFAELNGIAIQAVANPPKPTSISAQAGMGEIEAKTASKKKEIDAQNELLQSIRGQISSGIDAGRLARLAPRLAQESINLQVMLEELVALEDQLADAPNSQVVPSEIEPEVTAGIIRRADIRHSGPEHEFFKKFKDAATDVWDAEVAAANKRDELNSKREELRWLLRDNTPPYLKSVEVTSLVPAFQKIWKGYRHEWDGFSPEDEQLLRLVTYLQKDYSRNIATRTKLIETLITDANDLNKIAYGHLQSYAKINPFPEDGLDAEFWEDLLIDSVVTISLPIPGAAAILNIARRAQREDGSGVFWKRLSIEFIDAGVNVAKPMVMSKQPLVVSLTAEAVFRVVDAFTTTMNPNWTVDTLPVNSESYYARSSLDFSDEIDFLNSIDKHLLHARLEPVRQHLESVLESRRYIQLIEQSYAPMQIATEFTANVILDEAPTFQEPDGAGDVMRYAVWSTFNEMKILRSGFKPLVFNISKSVEGWGLDHLTRMPAGTGGLTTGIVTGNPYANYASGSALKSGATSALIAAAQQAIKSTALDAVEEQRFELWERYLIADLEARHATFLVVQEGRQRRAERKILYVLETEIIPELLAKTESGGSRVLLEKRNAGIAGKEIEIILSFSKQVTDVLLTVNDAEVPVTRQSGSLYRAEIELIDFVSANRPKESQLRVSINARSIHSNEHTLDADPMTVAVWKSNKKKFEGYDNGPDLSHVVEVAPIERPFIYASYSRFRGDSGQVFLNFEPGILLGRGAWIGIFAEGSSDPIRRLVLTKLTGGEASLNVFLPPGNYVAKLFESSRHSIEVAREPFVAPRLN